MRFLLRLMIPAMVMLATPLASQTCCTGGVPLTGVINLQGQTSKLRASITYDHNKLADFIQGDRTLNNSFLERTTNTWLAQFDLSLSAKTSLTLLLPYSQLEEKNTSANTSFRANGLADASLWFGYRVFSKDQKALSIAGGIKLPTGKTDIQDDDNQFDLPLSLQPGTGSTDFMLGIAYNSALQFRPSLIFSFSGIYRFNTTGTRFAAHAEYRYSNEADLYLGLSEEFLVFNQLITPMVQLRVNHFGEHQISGNDNPNTGGSWVFLGPGFSWAITPYMSFNFRSQLPLHRSVNGFQLTTSERFIFSASFGLLSDRSR